MTKRNLKHILRHKTDGAEFEFGSLLHDFSEEFGLILAVASIFLLINR